MSRQLHAPAEPHQHPHEATVSFDEWVADAAILLLCLASAAVIIGILALLVII